MGGPKRLRFLEVEDPAPTGGGKVALKTNTLAESFHWEDWKSLTRSWGRMH